MAKQSISVKSTVNYDLFERNPDNRCLNMRKHQRLARSMKKHGFLPYWPVVCYRNGSSKLSILDGQHRLAEAKAQGLPVFYVECLTEHAKDLNIAEINNTQKVWQTIDYAETYATKGLADYQEVMEFASRHSVSIAVSASLLSGTVTYSNIEREFKIGKYKVKDREWANRVVGIYGPITAMSKSVKHSKFLEACMAVCRIDDFNPARLIECANRCREKLVGYSNRDTYIQMIEDIYNFGRRHLVALKVPALSIMKDRSALSQSNLDRRKKSASKTEATE